MFEFLANIFGYLLNWLYMFVQNYGLAMILFSIIFKLAMLPLSIKQQATMKKSAKIQGKLKEIQAKYKSNPEKMNQETIALYKSEKMSPFSGCLSGIFQIVIILAVFYLVRSPLTYMKKIDPQIINDYTVQLKEEGKLNQTYPEISIIQQKGAQDENVNINMEFLGLDLSKVPIQSMTDIKTLIIPVLYVITSFIIARLTANMQKQKKKEDEQAEKSTSVIKVEEKDKPKDELDSVQQANKMMTYFAPIMSVSIAIVAPLGLALYWLISNILMIIERVLLNIYFAKKEEKQENE